MSPSTPNDRLVTYRRAQRGQTLIVALAVLFLLLFIGGLFVTRVGRNLVTAGRSRDTSDAQALAQAGLDYCNKQLNETPEGADWRPIPTTPISNNDPDYYYLERGFTRVPLKGGRALVRVAYDPHPANPSGQAFRIESIGITGELPVNGSDPTVFITAASQGHIPRLRRELVAYKQIGLTDYARYITNKYRRNDPNFIGTPGIGNSVATVLGNPMLGFAQYQNGIGNNNEVLYGFPMRINGNVVLGSDTYIYESPRGVNDPTLMAEKVLMSGSVELESQHRTQAYSSLNDMVYPAYMNQQINQAPNPNNAIRATKDPNGFTTFAGIFRDADANPDANGYVRSVSFLTPPSLDTLTGNGVLRYRSLTRDSGRYYKDPITGQNANTGQYGYGAGIYINNDTDRQLETQTAHISGSYSQRADWLNPNASFAQGHWNGPFYRPPGVIVELLGNAIRLTRTDDKSFLNADGSPNLQGDGKTLIIPLSNLDRRNVQLPNVGVNVTLSELPHDGDDGNNPNTPYNDKTSYGVNVVLFAEGNIRVKGVYGAITDPTQTLEQDITLGDGSVRQVRKLGRVHLTLVSGGTAYIEGNLIRGDGYLPSGGGQAIMERASTCAILAKDYVCINTTMFMQPRSQTSVWSRINQDLNDFGDELGQSQQSFDAGFSWGVDPRTYNTNGSPSTVWLFVRHGVLGGTGSVAAINLLVNPGIVDPTQGAGLPGNYLNTLYLFNEYGFNGQATQIGGATYLPTPETYLLGEKFLPNGTAIAMNDVHAQVPNFEMKVIPLNTQLHKRPIDHDITTNPNGALPLTLTPGYTNTLRFQIDQTAQALFSGQAGDSAALGAAAISDYVLSALMVAPLDIRIEAALYAQEKSFFVIPGYAVNPDSNDTRQHYVATNQVRVSYSGLSPVDGGTDPTGTDTQEDQTLKSIYPYYNDPVDVRITIFGSVTENYAASQSDQQAWMARWGFIPATYGASNINVPDDHLMVHDPYDNAHEFANLVPGLDTTIDYRTPIEALPITLPPGVNTISGDLNPFRITRGMRMMYDPALAMPYFHPTDNGLSPDTALVTRKQRALRFIKTDIKDPKTQTVLYTIVQVLPPIPRLPVCPNYSYAGDSERLIGSDRFDTDNMNP